MPTINLPLKKKREYSLDLNNARKVVASRFYSSPGWRSLRMAKLSANPLCERCESLKKVTLACEVHHVQKFMNGLDEVGQADLFYNYSNLLSVCISCHHILDKCR